MVALFGAGLGVARFNLSELPGEGLAVHLLPDPFSRVTPYCAAGCDALIPLFTNVWWS